MKTIDGYEISSIHVGKPCFYLDEKFLDITLGTIREVKDDCVTATNAGIPRDWPIDKIFMNIKEAWESLNTARKFEIQI